MNSSARPARAVAPPAHDFGPGSRWHPACSFEESAPPFCTRADPVREDATGSARFWRPTAPAGHVGCIEEDVGRGTLSRHPLTTRFAGRILPLGFPQDF